MVSTETSATLKIKVASVQDMLTHAYFERVSVNKTEIKEFLRVFTPLLSGGSTASQNFLQGVFSNPTSEETSLRIARFLTLMENAGEKTFRPKLEEMQDAMQIFYRMYNALSAQERQRAA